MKIAALVLGMLGGILGLIGGSCAVAIGGLGEVVGADGGEEAAPTAARQQADARREAQAAVDIGAPRNVLRLEESGDCGGGPDAERAAQEGGGAFHEGARGDARGEED